MSKGKFSNFIRLTRQYGRLLLCGVVLLVLLGLIYIRLREDDSFEDYSTAAGYVTEETDGAEAGIEEPAEDPVTGSAASEASAEEETGDFVLFAEGFPQNYLYSGTYDLAITACTETEGAYYQVVDLWTNTVLAEGSYAPGEESHRITFTTSRNYQNVVIRSWVPVSSVQDAEERDDETGPLTITSYWMRSEGAVCSDARAELVLILALCLLLWYGAQRAVRKRKPLVLAVSLLSLTASLPFLCNYLPGGHDVLFHIMRIFSLGQSFSEGIFPQRLDLVMGGGSISPILYPELSLYGAGLLCTMGTTALFAYRATQIFITFLTAFVSCWAARQVSGSGTAFWFAFVYVLNPYRLNELFVRGAVGEALGMAFLPLILVGIWRILCGDVSADSRAGAADLAFGFTGVISSHIILTVISAYACLILALIVFLAHPCRFLREVKRLLWIGAAAGVTVLLNLWFLVPFLQFFELDTAISASSDFSRLQESAVYLWQIFMNVSEFGADNGTSASASGEMSMTLGIAALIGVWIFLLMLLHDQAVDAPAGEAAAGLGDAASHCEKATPGAGEGFWCEACVLGGYETALDAEEEGCQRSGDRSTAETWNRGSVWRGGEKILSPREKQMGLLCLAAGGLFLFMASSFFPWDWLCEKSAVIAATLGKIQYSWRLLTAAACLLSAVLTIVIRALWRRGSGAGVLAGALIVICALYAAAAGTEYYNSAGEYAADKFSIPLSMRYDYVLSFADTETVDAWIRSGDGPRVLTKSSEHGSRFEITSYQRTGTDYVFSYVNTTGEDVTVTVPVLWYGLHTAALSEGMILSDAMNESLQFTDIVLPAQVTEGTVSLVFEEPLMWKIAEWISLGTLAAVMVLAAGALRKRRRAEREAKAAQTP